MHETYIDLNECVDIAQIPITYSEQMAGMFYVLNRIAEVIVNQR